MIGPVNVIRSEYLKVICVYTLFIFNEAPLGSSAKNMRTKFSTQDTIDLYQHSV